MVIFNNAGTKITSVLKARSGSELYPKKIFLGIVFFGLVCRIYISFFTNLPNIHTDSQDYFTQADTLLKGGYINFFPNGYPFIVAIVKACSGSSSIIALLWLNILMSVLIIYFTYDITNKISGREMIALIA